jgi:ABC-type multidrug transport system fused ATPase/permease subunit
MALLRLWRAAVGRYYRAAVWCVVLAVFSGFAEALGIAAALPLLSGALKGKSDVAQQYFGLQGDTLVAVALVALITLGLLSALLRYLADVAALRLQANVEESLRSRMTGALLNMAWPSFLKLSLGETGKSVLIEATQVGVGTQYIVSAIGYTLIAASFIVVALVISPLMTAATLVFGAFMALVYRAAGKRAGDVSRHLSGEAAELTETTTDVFGNAKFYRSSGLRETAIARADSGYHAWRNLFYRVQKWQPMTRLVFDTAGLVFIAGILGLSLLASSSSPLKPLVFLALFYRLAPKLQQAQGGILGARTQASWWTTWKERYDTAISDVEPPSGSTALTTPPTLAFDEVSYSFPGHDVPAVHDVSWELPADGCVAFVGESGGGKTTLLDLVTGLMVPTSGSVTLDGRNLREMDLESWRRRVGFVMQDAPIFFGTVLENIAWGSDAPDRARADRAAELAHLGDVLRAMPDGLDTHLGQKGARLSGGQRQRVALARALYREPWLLVLDEATSALDGDSERVIQDALVSLKGQCSMLVVAHRIKTVQLADRILVLVGGRVVEDGSWDSLMATDGAFRKMAAAQGIHPTPTGSRGGA